MKLINFKKVKDGKYLKNYELTYLNKSGREKCYEIVSHYEMSGPEELGSRCSGVSIAAIVGDRLLLLKEFRMGVNREVYNLCAGMIKDGETLEDCIARELFEETGLQVKRILKIFPPAFAAVALSDIQNQIVFLEAAGELSDEHTSANEMITAGLYGKEQVKDLLERGAAFSSRAQIIAYFFSEGKLLE